MTRTLTLIRHAKSSWKDVSLTDFERPLNKRGQQNAPVMGHLLKQAGTRFDLMVSSPALRAITTAKIIAEAVSYPLETLMEEPHLYGASVSELLDIVHALPDKKTHIALIAHNPGLTEFCNYLSDENINNIPTCGIAELSFDLDSWQAVFRSTGRLARFEYPRKYTE